jgi:hypothetical protein
MPDHRKCPRDPNRLGKFIVDVVARQGDTLIADQAPPQEVWRLGSVLGRDPSRRVAPPGRCDTRPLCDAETNTAACHLAENRAGRVVRNRTINSMAVRQHVPNV